jgi:lipid-A-disaccharide synthase
MFNNTRKPHIAIVAGEMSGDALGAGLIRAIRQRYPDAHIEGIGGQQMLEAGMYSHYPMELLSVMGLVEVLGRYLKLRACHNFLRQHFSDERPDIFIGIDAPDFNLSLEQHFKEQGIPTLHYVSPTVWAWREKRIHKIRRACDHMLVLYPFEETYFKAQQFPVTCVGHPFAQQIPLENDTSTARQTLGLDDTKSWVALLVGSRENEVSRLSLPFLQAAAFILSKNPNIRFIVPLANAAMRAIFERHLTPALRNLPLTLIDGQAREAMAAADVVLLASGTATLEATLLKKPMVVAYKLSPLTYAIAKRLVKIKYFSQPNLLSGEALVPEFIQNEAQPEKLGAAVLAWLNDHKRIEHIQTEFMKIHQHLQRDSDNLAAQAVLKLAGY